MINTELLDKKMSTSGLKTSFIISQLGLSNQGFYNKKSGKTPFRISEIYVLCDLLKISDDEKAKIFYP